VELKGRLEGHVGAGGAPHGVIYRVEEAAARREEVERQRRRRPGERAENRELTRNERWSASPNAPGAAKPMAVAEARGVVQVSVDLREESEEY
jgi:hypothetical protein